jgi:hypothetical protein
VHVWSNMKLLVIRKRNSRKMVSISDRKVSDTHKTTRQQPSFDRLRRVAKRGTAAYFETFLKVLL